MKTSEFMKLKSADFWKGLLLAVITAAITAAYTAITTTTDLAQFDWQPVGIASIGAFAAYILKNLFTNSEGTPLKPEQ